MISIEQTNMCNIHCTMCPNRMKQREQGYMKNTMFKDILNQISGNPKDERISIHGLGEPLVNPDFIKNINSMIEHKFTNVDFSTNGLLLTGEIADSIYNNPCISWIKISLNSCKKKMMETINTGSIFEIVVKNIKDFIGRKPECKVVIQKMVTPETVNETAQDYKDLLDSENFILQTIDMYDFKGNQKTAFNEKLLGCNGLYAKDIYIHWNGDLVGCCCDDTNNQTYGNISDGIYSEGVNALRSFYQDKFRGRKYSFLPLCEICLNQGDKNGT